MTNPDYYRDFFRLLDRELAALCQTHGEREGVTRFQDLLDTRARQEPRR